jgi:hypothetical protein
MEYRSRRGLTPDNAGVPGLEPRTTEPESAVLPITPYPKAPAGTGPSASLAHDGPVYQNEGFVGGGAVLHRGVGHRRGCRCVPSGSVRSAFKRARALACVPSTSSGTVLLPVHSRSPASVPSTSSGTVGAAPGELAAGGGHGGEGEVAVDRRRYSRACARRDDELLRARLGGVARRVDAREGAAAVGISGDETLVVRV